MKTLLTYKELEMLNHDETPLNESMDSLKVFAKKSYSVLKNAIRAKLKREAPSLADNANFIEQLANSYSNNTEKNKEDDKPD